MIGWISGKLFSKVLTKLNWDSVKSGFDFEHIFEKDFYGVGMLVKCLGIMLEYSTFGPESWIWHITVFTLSIQIDKFEQIM